MTIKSTGGMSGSAYQTASGARPEIFSIAAIMSRSRFEPGKTTTADLIGSCGAFVDDTHRHAGIDCMGPSDVCSCVPTGHNLYPVVLDDSIGEKLFGHGTEGSRSASRIGLFHLDFEDLALPYAFDPGKTERRERALDCFALRVEDPRF